MPNLSKAAFCAIAENKTSKVCEKYSILVLEAANYMGYMTSEFVAFMEKFAYYSARDDCNNVTHPDAFPHRPLERVAMPELFDMIAGSETGALVASTLVIPNDGN